MNKPSSTNLLPPHDAGCPFDYQDDFVLWIDGQLELLRARKFEQLDLDNIIEELDSMGKRERRELGSRLEILLIHLLKCQYQPAAISRSWLGTLSEQRSQIMRLLKHNPSLGLEVEQQAAESYACAVFRAAQETGLPENLFPSENPYSKQDLLDLRFIP
jgi:hypothetical protein